LKVEEQNPTTTNAQVTAGCSGGMFYDRQAAVSASHCFPADPGRRTENLRERRAH
jgi:hypothetical protein